MKSLFVEKVGKLADAVLDADEDEERELGSGGKEGGYLYMNPGSRRIIVEVFGEERGLVRDRGIAVTSSESPSLTERFPVDDLASQAPFPRLR